MVRVLSYFALLIVTLLPAIVRGQLEGDFVNFRQCDVTGRYYIVIKKTNVTSKQADEGRGWPVAYEWAERKEGSEPVTDESDDYNDVGNVTRNEKVNVRPGDILLGSGELARCPSQFVISSQGHGFAGLDVRGYNFGFRRSKDAMVLVDKSGTVRHRKSLLDLYSKAEIDQWDSSGGGITWLAGGWFDEIRGELVIIGQPCYHEDGTSKQFYRTVDVLSGTVRTATADVVTTALKDVNRGAFPMALDLAKELRWKPAEEHLPPILGNEKLPLEIRIDAARLLADFGDLRGAPLLTDAALDGNGTALLAIPVVAGPLSAKIICNAVRKHGEKIHGEAWQAMCLVPSHIAVPELTRILDRRRPTAMCDFAMLCLNEHAAEAGPAIPALIKILKSPPKTESPEWTRQRAALVLAMIGPGAKDALPTLIELADRYAPEEWKMAQLGLFRPQYDESRIAENDFVEAIWRIKGPP